MRSHLVPLMIACGACGGHEVAATAPGSNLDPVTQRVTPPNTYEFTGMCDASASVGLDEHRFIVADDEDNVLRLYDAQGGAPLSSVDLSEALALERTKSKEHHWPESDLEAGTAVGDTAIWLSSHGRSNNGTLRPERLRLFATTLTATPVIVGRVYTHLLDDIINEPRFARFDLRRAAARSPKAEGGFNIEGMTATPEGGAMIGLRNPVPAGKALVFPLLNPVAALVHGAKLAFGDPVALDLGGRGVRALSYWRGRYLIAAGSATDSLALLPQLYTWDGKGEAKLVVDNVGGINPEAFFSPDKLADVLVFSDDGTQMIGGTRCKELTDVSKKSFRASWMRMGN